MDSVIIRNARMDRRAAVTLYVGRIPEIFGYGLEAYGATKEEAVRLLRREHAKWRKGYGGEYTFEEAVAQFGGTVRQVSSGMSGAEGDIGEFVWSEEDIEGKEGE